MDSNVEHADRRAVTGASGLPRTPQPSASNTQDGDGSGDDAFPSALRANYALAVVSLAYVFSFIDRQILSLLVDPIRKSFAIGDFEVSLLQGFAFAIFYVVLGLPIGRLADRASRRTIIASGIFLWSLMTLSCGLARSFGTLFLARIGVGVGEAGLSPAVYSMLSDTFPPLRLARATSIFTMGITIGGGLAYLVGGYVVAFAAHAHTASLPYVGSVAPWQLTFFVVGLPGFVLTVFVLAMREPRRRHSDAVGSGAQTEKLSQVLRFLLKHRRSHGAIYASIAFLSVLGYGTLNWYPTFLMRSYRLSVGEVGLRFGLIYLVFGSAGALGGAALADWLRKKGHPDANLRTVMLVSLAVIAPAALGPLMPSAVAALVLAAPTVFLLNGYFGVSIAALQLITPNRMRGLNSALFLLINNLAGLAIGSSAVPILTEYVFRNDLAVRYALAVLPIIVCPVAAFIAYRGLAPYRAALLEAVSLPIPHMDAMRDRPEPDSAR